MAGLAAIPQAQHWVNSGLSLIAHGWSFGEREMIEVLLLQSLRKKLQNTAYKMLSIATRHPLKVFLLLNNQVRLPGWEGCNHMSWEAEAGR